MIKLKSLTRAIRYYLKHNLRKDIKYTLSKEKTMVAEVIKLSTFESCGRKEVNVPKLPLSAISSIRYYYKSFAKNQIESEKLIE